MNNYKSFAEIKEEFGTNYDFKLYEMGISALKEIEQLQQANQELKSQLKGTTHCYDGEEHRKLENNWNELKRWLYEEHYLYVPEIARNSIYQKVLEKMYEIEKESNSNEI